MQKRSIEFPVIRAAIGRAVVTGLLGQGVLLVSGVAAARLLGPEDRGLLAFVLIVPTVIATVGTLGVPQALVVLGNRSNRVNETVGAAWRIFVWQLVCLMVLFSAILILWQSPKIEIASSLHIYSSLVLILTLATSYLAATLQVEREFHRLNHLRVVPLAAYAVWLLLLVATDQNEVAYVLLGWTLIHSLYLGGLFLRLRGPIFQGMKTAGLSDMKLLTSFGLKGHLGTVSIVDSLQMDKIVIGSIISSGALGLFVVAQSFSNLPKILVANASQVISPSIAHGLIRPHLFYKKALFLGGGVATVLGGGLIALLPMLIPLIFGEEFAESVRAAQYLTAAGVIAALRRFSTECTTAMGHPGIGSMSEIVMAGVFTAGCVCTYFRPFIETMAMWMLMAQIAGLAHAFLMARAALDKDAARFN